MVGPGGAALAQPAPPQDEKPLVILSEAAHPPYAYFVAKGEMAGFEIDLMKALCARINRPCQFKHREFDRLVPALIARKGDVIVSSLEITDERREKFTLSRAYFRMPFVILARKDDMPKALTPDALTGLSIGALRDSSAASLVEERFPGAQLEIYPTQVEANLDLVAGRIDLAIGDEISSREWLKTAPESNCCIAVGRVDDPTFAAGEGFAIVMRKGEDELKAKLDAALQEERNTGGYAAIARKYFDFELP